MEIILLIVQAASTWFMTGLIWFVQVVHYPLYDRIGESQFVIYERDHCALTTAVVAPAMVIEFMTAALLVLSRPKAVCLPEVLAGLALLLLIWGSTVFIADNLHGTLASGFNNESYRALVAWNWLRTVAWTWRAALVSYMCWRCMI